MTRVLLPCVLLLACGPPAAVRRTFEVEVTSVKAPLVTDSGWAVTLDRASFDFASLRFFGSPAVAGWRRAEAWLLGSAWAHPGHGAQGEALAEVLAPLTADLLADAAVSWGAAEAVTGDYRTATLGFGPGGVELAGRAERNGHVVPFSARVVPAAPLAGLPFSRTVTTSGRGVRLSVSLPGLLSRVDFSEVGAGASPLDAASPAFNGIQRGVTDTSVYVLTWEE
jgi:hypothetical protein